MSDTMQKKRKRPSQHPPCKDPVFAEGRAKRESGTTTLGHVAVRFQAMVGEEAQAAYSRTYVNEYRRAWDKSWPYLCEMLEIIEAEKTYSKPWMKDGVPQRTYETFQAYCEAEVEPFVGPIATLREQYRQFKNGEVDVEGGARCQRRAHTVARCREAYQELQHAGAKITQRAVADRAGITQQWVDDLWPEITGEMSSGDISPVKTTQRQRAAALGISRYQLHRMDSVAKYQDLQDRTALPESDPQHLSTRKAYMEVRRREGRLMDDGFIGPIKNAISKLSKDEQRQAVEWLITWAREHGHLE